MTQHCSKLAQRVVASVSEEVQKAQRRAAIGISLRQSGHFLVVGSGAASPRRIRARSVFIGSTMKKYTAAAIRMNEITALMLYTGRVLASSQLNTMMHLCRELSGGQICVTPDFAAFQNPETAAWLDKYYSINVDWQSEDRRRLLAFARDLLNSD